MKTTYTSLTMSSYTYTCSTLIIPINLQSLKHKIAWRVKNSHDLHTHYIIHSYTNRVSIQVLIVATWINAGSFSHRSTLYSQNNLRQRLTWKNKIRHSSWTKWTNLIFLDWLNLSGIKIARTFSHINRKGGLLAFSSQNDITQRTPNRVKAHLMLDRNVWLNPIEPRERVPQYGEYMVQRKLPH